MKKHLKKLALHRETLRSLGGPALQGAAGGAKTDRCETAFTVCPIGSNVPSGCVNTYCHETCDPYTCGA